MGVPRGGDFLSAPPGAVAWHAGPDGARELHFRETSNRGEFTSYERAFGA